MDTLSEKILIDEENIICPSKTEELEGLEKEKKGVSVARFFVKEAALLVKDTIQRNAQPVTQEELERYQILNSYIAPILKNRFQDSSSVYKEKNLNPVLVTERILNILFLEEQKRKKPIDEFTAQFNAHFFEQRLQRDDLALTRLKFVDPNTTYYPQQEEYSKLVPWALEKFATNMSEVKEDFSKNVAPEIEEILKNKSLLIVTNHDAWTTLLISAYVSSQSLRNFKSEQNGIVLGPALNVFSSKGIDPECFARGIANVYSTIPNTKNGRPTDLPLEKLDRIAKNAGLKIIKDLLGKGGDEKKIIHMAPSSTTDRREDGQIILPKIPEDVSGLLAKLYERGVPILPIGFNQNGMYGNGGRPQKKNINVGFGNIIYPGDLQNDSEEDISTQIMQRIAEQVKDDEKNVIGRYAA